MAGRFAIARSMFWQAQAWRRCGARSSAFAEATGASPTFRSPGSHLEKLGIARLDLLALRQHRGGIGFEQFQRRQRWMAGLFLDLPMERAMREIIDQQLLSFRTEKEALEQPRRVRIRRAAEHATGNDDDR